MISKRKEAAWSKILIQLGGHNYDCFTGRNKAWVVFEQALRLRRPRILMKDSKVRRYLHFTSEEASSAQFLQKLIKHTVVA